MKHAFPKLHNAMWPGLVGKGPDAEEPAIDLDTMLRLTAEAEVDGQRFDGVDLFLYQPHVDIDITDDELNKLADKIHDYGFAVGSVVAPVWFDASAMGDKSQRENWLAAIRKACRIARQLREIGIRPYGVVRIDSAASVAEWAKNPSENQRTIVDSFRRAADIGDEHGEMLAAEGEICWGGMHSWRVMLDLLQQVDRRDVLGFQADMAHTLLYTLGYNAPEDRLLPENFDWNDRQAFDTALRTVVDALRPWTIDIHIAQNDATVKGSGSHDKTGRHCTVDDANGKLDIVHHAGFWLRDENGEVTRAVEHICWDGCMFPNDTMLQVGTWNNILSKMIEVRDAHGFN